MKSQRVFMRISNSPSPEARDAGAEIKHTWYCIEYPPFNTLHDPSLGVWRAQAMLALHHAATRVFYIGSPAAKGYVNIKTDGVYEYPEPSELRDLKGYNPEFLATMLDILDPPPVNTHAK